MIRWLRFVWPKGCLIPGFFRYPDYHRLRIKLRDTRSLAAIGRGR